jgi:hypothetical protein
MKAYGDSVENLRRFSILEMDGENGQLHFSVPEEEFSSYQLWWEGARNLLDAKASREFRNYPLRMKTTAVNSVLPS